MQYEMKPEQLERFLSRIDRDSNRSGCWLWTGAKTTAGYGETWNGKVLYTHRVAYELWVGPIPDRFTIDHLCKNKACLNPAHLEACTQRTNILRSESQSAIHARKTHCHQGHEFTPENTYQPPTGGRICRACRKTYMAEWRERNREYVTAYNKRWWAENRGRQ